MKAKCDFPHIDYTSIPNHCREGMLLYIENGIIPGDFLRAVLENNFVEVIGRADLINRRELENYAGFLYWEMPSGSWGSREKVLEWSERRRNA